MTTTAPRVKAGGPPPLQLHRGIVAPIPSAHKTRPLQIDFVLPDEDEQAVRDGFDAAMKAPLPKREDDAETVEQYDRDATEIAWVGWLLIACLLAFISSGIGYMAGRYFS